MGKEFQHNPTTAKYALVVLVMFLLLVSYRYYQCLLTLNLKVVELQQTADEFEWCRKSEQNLRDVNSKCSKSTEELKTKSDDLLQKLGDMNALNKEREEKMNALADQIQQLTSEKEQLEARLTKTEIDLNEAKKLIPKTQPAPPPNAALSEAAAQPVETAAQAPAAAAPEVLQPPQAAPASNT